MSKLYQVIYADPPWQYRSKTGRGMKHGASMKYPTMPLEDIKSMKIPAGRDSVLYLWATVPLMPEAFEVMKAWGFKYKTALTWRKIMSMGMGYWYRGQTEHLLFGVRGGGKSIQSTRG